MALQKKKRVFLDLGAGKISPFGLKPRLMQMAEREKAKKKSAWSLIGVDPEANLKRGQNFSLIRANALDYLKKTRAASVDVINSDLFVGSIYFDRGPDRQFTSHKEFWEAVDKRAKEIREAEKQGKKESFEEWLKRIQQKPPVTWRQKPEDLEAYLREIKRALKPNGRLYLTVELKFMPVVRETLAAEGFKVIGAEEASIPFGKKQTKTISPVTWKLLEDVRRARTTEETPIRLVAVKKGMK